MTIMVPFLLWVLGNSNPYSPVEKKQREAVTSGSVEYISWPRIVQNVLSFCLYLLKISYKVSDLTLGPGGPGAPGRPWKTNRETVGLQSDAICATLMKKGLRCSSFSLPQGLWVLGDLPDLVYLEVQVGPVT